MTGLTRSSADLDERRRRILYRCWHRGIREMDLILGQFAEVEIAGFGEEELDALEEVMREEDQDLISWINGSRPVPERMDTPMFRRIAATRPRFDVVTMESLGAR
ncbi:succinate dehydrogenase assembly factor 2 [Rhizobiaceae bacterium BDR2-2]|uniref:FAD assembly factor SdhE n=1 Tax=Ectorhizobium quercum TaxID=2965071 RepID=A0AAE3N327_9HYPH|nr:succinate dehydrogenase assembly factor 2 [Ectorhizobium quercum]MCX8997682.1 succinate dehydrogenase assembly factor 2 [Ectorhizobium quercum]